MAGDRRFSRYEGLNVSGFPWPSPITEFCNNGTGACARQRNSDHHRHRLSFLQHLPFNKGSWATGSGDGCILSYDITNPTLSSSPARAQVTDEVNPGCWATSGIEVDNSVPTVTLAGASQIYFVNLNGNGAGGPTNGTYTSTVCGAQR